jgi:choline dehydrogenase-like flavoprotein
MSNDQVIIIGSGPTGSIAAWTLVNAGINVTLLESGNSFPKDVHIRLWNKEIRRPYALEARDYVPYPNFENEGNSFTRWEKAHLLGGLGNFWGGVTLRFAPEDFTEGELISERFRWPINYSDLEPYYQRVEDLIGVSGHNKSVPGLPACRIRNLRHLPQEFNDLVHAAEHLHRSLLPINEVYGQPFILSQVPSPFNVGVRLLGQLQQRKNFRIIHNAHVTRLVLHKTKALTTGVEYIDRQSGNLCFEAGKVVMLAAGQLGSTHILLNSCSSNFAGGIDDPHGLIGRYLHDNMYAAYLYKVDRPSPKEAVTLYLTRPDYNADVPLRTTAFQIYAAAHKRPHENLRQNLGLTKMQLNDEGFDLLFACFGTQVPNQSRYVSLHPSAKDQYGLPLLRINTYHDQDDLRTLDKGRHTAEELLKIGGWAFSPNSIAVEPPGTSVHFGGTIRMHNNPKFGVLNALNCMHDIPNIFVIDASCFTTCVEKNPTLTGMAIAMRAADLLSQSRGHIANN